LKTQSLSNQVQSHKRCSKYRGVLKKSFITCPSSALLDAILFFTIPNRKRRPALSLSASRWICSANSRVGASSRTLMPPSLARLPLVASKARAGMTKAAVLPEPCNKKIISSVNYTLNYMRRATLLYRWRRSQEIPSFSEHRNRLHLDGGGFFPITSLNVAQHHR
jgi:hypothetical protein